MILRSKDDFSESSRMAADAGSEELGYKEKREEVG